jgi:hypothetical protein
MKIGHKIVTVGAGVLLAAAGLGSAATGQSLAASAARLCAPAGSAASAGPSKPRAGVPATTSQTATSPCSPVSLATPVNFADGHAASGATVTAGKARFEVLGSGLI